MANSASVDRNFCVVENDTWEFNVTLVDKDTQVPLDLTGATVRLDVRASHTASAVSLPLSEGDGITVPSPKTQGIIQVSKDAAISDGTYVYDLQVEFSGGKRKTYLRGQLTVLPEVTS